MTLMTEHHISLQDRTALLPMAEGIHKQASFATVSITEPMLIWMRKLDHSSFIHIAANLSITFHMPPLLSNKVAEELMNQIFRSGTLPPRMSLHP